ncbi:MAG: penicillin-binding protein 2 [Actinomycetota bacterium]|nr:penicillin-binding protein 2 [Actinomycetota bacterium]MDA3018915.1 penicillin-binding protein 2 [Actinomycetota bacterium]
MTPRKPASSRTKRVSTAKNPSTSSRRASSPRPAASRSSKSRSTRSTTSRSSKSTASRSSRSTASRSSKTTGSRQRTKTGSSFLSSRLAPQDAHQAKVWRIGAVRRRFRWFAGITASLLVALIAWSVIVQVVKGNKLRAYGVDQRESNIKIPAARGTIFDRDGNEMAITVPALSLYADPRAVLDPSATAHVLGQMLGFDVTAEAELATKLANQKQSFVYIQRFVDEDVAAAVLSLNLSGVNGVSEPKRVQVAGGLATNIIGRTDPFGTGATGLELQYDKVLTGIDGEMVKQASRGRSLPGTSHIVSQARPGTDLVLTVDRSMQFQTEQALLSQVNELSARGGNAIILDSKTGEVLSIASVRRGNDGVAAITSGNLAAVESYEPGSVAKVFSMAATIDSGIATPERVYEVAGTHTFDKDTEFEYTIQDAFPHDLEPMTLRSILVRSSNIGTMMAAGELGSPKLHSYLSNFGFGKLSELEFPGESAGILKDPQDWKGSQNGTIAYGYGFSSTSLQLVSAVNAVANKGVYVSPKFVRATIDEKGSKWETPSGSSRRVISEESAATMTEMLTGVVCEGTGSRAQVNGISVAGKTGTGYKIQDNGTYKSDDGLRSYFATFVGYFPAKDPVVTILVSIDEPDRSSRDRFGGTAAAPVFASLAEVAIQELSIQPTLGDTGCPLGG